MNLFHSPANLSPAPPLNLSPGNPYEPCSRHLFSLTVLAHHASAFQSISIIIILTERNLKANALDANTVFAPRGFRNERFS